MAATSAIAQRSFDETISALDAETSALGAATSAITRSYRRYRCGVSGDCGVGITPQMCNRVTNHGDMSTFSKPVWQRRRPSRGGHSMRRRRRLIRRRRSMRRRRRSMRRRWRSVRRRRRSCGVTGDIGVEFPGPYRRLRSWYNSADVNRVTNHGDMSTFSKPSVKCQTKHSC